MVEMLLSSVLHFSDIDDLFDVYCEVIDVAHNWKGLGKALRLRPSVLERIEADRQFVKARLNDVLTEWLQEAYNTERFGLPSWKLLVAAVAHPAGGNNNALARRIAKKYKGMFYLIQPQWIQWGKGIALIKILVHVYIFRLG